MMTDQPGAGTAEGRERQAYAARTFARQAVHGLARELGAQATSRPMVRHDPHSPAVRDYDPVSGPYDNEPGHQDDCERLAAAVTAWEAQWDES